MRKLTVSPIYSCRERMFPTLSADQWYGMAGGLRYAFPMLFQYSVGVITLSALSFFAICAGPSPATHISKIRRTISAAGSSISHSVGLSGFFLYPKGRLNVKGLPDIPLFLNTFRTFWLVFLACHSLNKSCIGTRSLMPFSVSILSMMAIYRTSRRSKSSSNNCPTTRRLRPSLEWSLTIIVPIFPCSAKSIISIKEGLVNVTPENPSSTKKRGLRNPFSFAYFSSMDCWFLMLPESPSCSSSRLKRQYKAVIFSG